MSLDFIISIEVLGQNGIPFMLYKFQTMNSDCDKVLFASEFDGLGKPIDDPRITLAGKILRKYFIDETPQFLNLVRGNLSIVGLRPRSEEYWDKIFAEYKQEAIQYKPGLFGIIYADTFGYSLDDFKKAELNYLEKKDKKPILTDIIYFSKIIYNVVLRGIRSH